jgi:alpha-L-rhamnosidase
VYGPARSAWTRSGSALTLSVVVPANSSATVRVPASPAAAVKAPAEAVLLSYANGAASYALPSGSYTFTTT